MSEEREEIEIGMTSGGGGGGMTLLIACLGSAFRYRYFIYTVRREE